MKKIIVVLVVLLMLPLALAQDDSSLNENTRIVSCEDITTGDSPPNEYIPGFTKVNYPNGSTSYFGDEYLNSTHIKEVYCELDLIDNETVFLVLYDIVDCSEIGSQSRGAEGSYTWKMTSTETETFGLEAAACNPVETPLEGTAEEIVIKETESGVNSEDPCFDLDGGLTITQKGSVYKGTIRVHTDKCDSNTGLLIEGICDGLTPKKQTYDCSQNGLVCQDGACVQSEGEGTGIEESKTPEVPPISANNSRSKTTEPSVEVGVSEVGVSGKDYLNLFLGVIFPLYSLFNLFGHGGLFGALEEKCMIPYEDITDLFLVFDNTFDNTEKYLHIKIKSGKPEYQPSYRCEFYDNDVPENEEDVNLDSIIRRSLDRIRGREVQELRVSSEFNQYYKETIKKALKEVFERIENLSLSDEIKNRIIINTQNNSKVIELPLLSSYGEYKIVVDKNDEILELFALYPSEIYPDRKRISMYFGEETWIKTYVNPLVREFLYGEGYLVEKLLDIPHGEESFEE